MKGVAIVPSGKGHFVDHLSEISAIMEIPLLFTEDTEYQLAKKYYPDIRAQQIDYLELTPQYLIEHYDVLFLSDIWNRHTFHKQYAALEKQYNKQLRHVHCPHGFSDKAFYLVECVNEDISLIYGQNMLDMIKYYGLLDQLRNYVITGNYRYTYFKKHRAFYDRIVKEEILNHFSSSQPLILYAPTWMDKDDSSTFFQATSYLIDRLPDEFNMLIKLHPLLELNNTAEYYQIIGRYENKPNVLFLKDFPPVFPLLAVTDIYIGDVSSIGYDFLAFNKPMFFLNKDRRDSRTDRSVLLYQCGREIYPEEYSNFYKILGESLATDQDQFGKQRQVLYNYSFGDERSFDAIRKDIENAYKLPLLI